MAVSCGTAPCGLVEFYPRLKGTCCPKHQGDELITMTLEAEITSETSVNVYQATRCNNPEDSHLRTHRRENLKSYIALQLFSST
jgi:hypothetical protein